eukprot:1404432-Rhodomonas_salina.1
MYSAYVLCPGRVTTCAGAPRSGRYPGYAARYPGTPASAAKGRPEDPGTQYTAGSHGSTIVTPGYQGTPGTRIPQSQLSQLSIHPIP